MKHLLKIWLLPILPFCVHAQSTVNNTPLFNGNDLNNWEKFLGPAFPGKDSAALHATPENVFSVIEQNGEKLIRISGEVHGSLATTNSYENFHLKMVFKWGTSVTEGRNSGILYSGYGLFGSCYQTWKPSMEFQLQHGSLGDAYMMISELSCETTATASADGKVWFFDRKGHPTKFGEHVKRRMIKNAPVNESPLGDWNTVEIYSLGDSSIHIVNGKVVLSLVKISRFSNGRTFPITGGCIQLQSEGAELFVKSVELRSIQKIPDAILDAIK